MNFSFIRGYELRKATELKHDIHEAISQGIEEGVKRVLRRNTFKPSTAMIAKQKKAVTKSTTGVNDIIARVPSMIAGGDHGILRDIQRSRSMLAQLDNSDTSESLLEDDGYAR